MLWTVRSFMIFVRKFDLTCVLQVAVPLCYNTRGSYCVLDEIHSGLCIEQLSNILYVVQIVRLINSVSTANSVDSVSVANSLNCANNAVAKVLPFQFELQVRTTLTWHV